MAIKPETPTALQAEFFIFIRRDQYAATEMKTCSTTRLADAILWEWWTEYQTSMIEDTGTPRPNATLQIGIGAKSEIEMNLSRNLFTHDGPIPVLTAIAEARDTINQFLKENSNAASDAR